MYFLGFVLPRSCRQHVFLPQVNLTHREPIFHGRKFVFLVQRNLRDSSENPLPFSSTNVSLNHLFFANRRVRKSVLYVNVLLSHKNK